MGHSHSQPRRLRSRGPQAPADEGLLRGETTAHAQSSNSNNYQRFFTSSDVAPSHAATAGSAGGAGGGVPSSATGSSSNRITVDIRGASLESDWNVMIKRQEDGSSRVSRVESGVRSASTTVSSMAGALVSVLMVAKLVEEILFIRNLRRELSTITASLSDGGGSGLEQHGQGGRSAAGKAAGKASGGGGSGGGLAYELMGLGIKAIGAAKGNETDDSVSWEKVAGLHEVKMLLQEVTVLPTLRPDLFTGIRQPPRGILLFGPPGSGKTLLARAVATESRSTFIPITGSSILSMWFGQSEQNVKQLFERARRQQPCVIFIDEVDSLLGRRSGMSPGGGGGGSGDSMPDKRVTNEFLSFIDGIQTGGADTDCRITIMAATNNPWDLDEAALSRFSRRIHVPLPDKATRAQLIQKALRGVACDMAGEQYMQLADKVAKYSGRDLIAVCREAAMQPVRELWGNRLLAGATSEEGRARAAQQRLVQVVSQQLAKGMPPKRVRKELEAYRRRQYKELEEEQREASRPGTDDNGGPAGSSGAAAAAASAGAAAAAGVALPAGTDAALAAALVTAAPAGSSTAAVGAEAVAAAAGPLAWLDVEVVMKLAEAAVLSTKKKGKGAKKLPSSASSSSVNHPPSSSAAALTSAAAANCGPAVDTALDAGVPPQPTVSMRPLPDDLEERKVRGGAASADDRTGSVAAECSPPVTSAAADGSDADERCGQGACGAANTGRKGNSGEIAHFPPLGEAPESETKAGEISVGPACGSSEETSAVPLTGGGKNPDAPGSKAAAGSAVDVEKSSCVTAGKSRSGVATIPKALSGTALAAKADAAAAGPAGLSIEALLALPSDQLRPVGLADFERALSIIMPSDFEGLTAKYEEWNSMYGSGADAKREGGRDGRKPYSTMYI